MTEQPKLILIRETLAVSLARDAGSVTGAWLLILPGYWLGSDALQWAGMSLFALILLSRAAGVGRQNLHTLDEAKAEIDRMIAEGRG